MKRGAPKRKYNEILPDIIAWMRDNKRSINAAAKAFNIPSQTLYRLLEERE